MIGASPQVSAAVDDHNLFCTRLLQKAIWSAGDGTGEPMVFDVCKSSRTMFCKTRLTKSAMRDRLLAVARMTVVLGKERPRRVVKKPSSGRHRDWCMSDSGSFCGRTKRTAFGKRRWAAKSSYTEPITRLKMARDVIAMRRQSS
jgi:hypothetical protein